jgi:hypothetical protein
MYLGIDLGTSNSAIVGNDGSELRLYKTIDGTGVLPSCAGKGPRAKAPGSPHGSKRSCIFMAIASWLSIRRQHGWPALCPIARGGWARRRDLPTSSLPRRRASTG